MSRILKYKKLIILITIIVMAEVLICILLWLMLAKVGVVSASLKSTIGNMIGIVVVIDVLLFLLFLFDYMVYRRIVMQMSPFWPSRKVRNVDYLVIGENCDLEKYGIKRTDSYVQLTNPGLSELMAFEMVRRTHSILKESGTIIVFLNRKKIKSKKIGVIDTIFLYDYTIKEYGLDRKSRFRLLVLFVEPIRSIKTLVGGKKTGYEQIDADGEFKDFCEDRGIKLRFYVK